MKTLNQILKSHKKALQLTAVASILTLTAACGKHEKNPLKNYDSLDKKVAPYEKEKRSSETKLAVYNIDYEGNLKFIQGEPKTVIFKARNAFTNNTDVRYDLLMTQGPMSEGAEFINNNNGTWSLKWNPKPTTLTSAENYRLYPVEIRFVLLPSSSALSKQQFAGVHPLTQFEAELTKDASQPIIDEDSIKFMPGQTLNPDQKATIQFIAAAKGLENQDSLQINVFAGQQALSTELAQMDAHFATSQKATRLRSLGPDSSGRSRFLYEVEFDARKFTDKILSEIPKIPNLNRKFQQGTLTTARAVFSIEAYNRYNNRTSPEKIIPLTVNLIDKAGAASIITDTEIQLAAGNTVRDKMILRSAGARGSVSLQKITIGETSADIKSGRAQIAVDGIKVSLSCTNKGNDAQNQLHGCVTGGCYQNCTISIDANCEASQGTKNLVISTTSKLGQEEAAADINYVIKLQGRQQSCVDTATASAGGQ